MEEKGRPTTVGGVPTGGITASGNETHNDDGTFGSKGDASTKSGGISLKDKFKQRLELKNKSLFVGVNSAYESKKNGIDSLKGFDRASEKNKRSRNLEKEITPVNTKILADKTKEMFENNKLGMRIKFGNLINVIKMNKFLNLHEAGHGGGCTNSDIRMGFSNSVFGSEYQSSRINRYGLEKYGCLVSKNIGESIDWSDGARQYGDCTVTFKNNRVKGRTTYTYGDSLSSRQVVPCIAGKEFNANCFVDRDTARDVNWNIDRIKNAKNVQEFKDALGISYVELQYHGDLTLDDVESIRVQDKWMMQEELREAIAGELKRKGIPVYTYDFREKKEYEIKINENGELYKEEVKL